MAKENGDIAHSMKLLERASLEMTRSWGDENTRKTIREHLRLIEESVAEMENRDEQYQERPDIKIKSLKKELKDNDGILTKNRGNMREQVQKALFQRDIKIPMYDTFIKRTSLEIEEDEEKLKNGFVPIHPTFGFQTSARWQELQAEFTKKHKEALEDNLKELQENVDDIINGPKGILKQNERIESRRVQIIEELTKLGEDTTHLE